MSDIVPNPDMNSYYSVGYREPCGHHHRTRTGAERCARAYLAASRADLKQEAQEHGMNLREYVDEIVAERIGDCLICRVTE